MYSDQLMSRCESIENNMNKYDYAIEATKIIVEHCTLIKLRFSESVTSLLANSEKLLPLPKLPLKRLPSSPIILEKQASVSSSSEESTKPMEMDLKKFLSSHPKIFEEELLRVYSSELSSESEKTFKTCSVQELEKLVVSLGDSKTVKNDIEKINRFLEGYQEIGIEEKKRARYTIRKLEEAKIEFEDSTTKAMFNEAKRKARKLKLM